MSTTIAVLQGAHAALAHFGGPHWLLNDDDARAYALAVNNVARHYDIKAAQKTIDLMNLIGMACFVEGTRVLYSRNPNLRPQPQRPPAGAVVPLFQFKPPAYPPAPGPPPPHEGEPYGPPNPLAPEGPVH